LKSIKRIQNQLNYLSQYAKKLANKDDKDDILNDLENENIQDITKEISKYSSYIKTEHTQKIQTLTSSDIEKVNLLSVTNSLSEGLIIYSMDLEVILINPALAQMLMPSNPSGTGRLILNPDDRLFFERCINSQLMEKVQRALIENPTVPRADILELKSPKQVLKRYSSPLYDRDNIQVGHVIIYHDITAEMEVEEMRKDFISNASHELRTPVTSIKVLLESLLDGAKDEPHLLNEFLNDLMLEVNRLHELVNDLLDVARLESNKTTLQITNFSINDVVSEVVSTLYPLAKSKDIRLIPPIFKESMIMKADRQKIKQVFVNLVNNGVKFTPSPGEVSIFVKKLDSAYEFKVKDTGIGIPFEDQTHIFDKFYRVNKERSRMIGGSGLGLTIVKQIVEAHNGTIHVESALGNTIFTFRIPQ